MRYGFIIAAAAALIAGPAVAQGVTIDGPGVGIHVGPQHDHWRREHRWHERDVRGDCKSVTVKERGPDGSMISRTRTNC